MASLFGHARISFYHAPKTVSLQTKSGAKTDLKELCKDIAPPCRLNPLLPNGHFQTAMTVIKNQDIPIYYKRKIFEAENSAYAGTFAVDFVVDPNDEVDQTLPSRTTYFESSASEEIGSLDSKPMLILLHGLSGGSHELYLRHVIAPLVTKEGGWEACVVNSRGCAMSKITTGVLYNARSTWDVRQTVKWLKKKFPNRPLFGIGFSLGANILANYLGEEGSECLLKAAVVCSNPWNLEVSALALQQSWLGLSVYSKVMAGNMKRLFQQHVDQISKNPRIDVDRVMSVKYLHEFDRALQGPTWGYPTEGAYYRDSSSVDPLLAIRIPLLSINAEDDPIAVKEAIPFEEFRQNPYTILCTTSLGGHLSWFELGGGRWFVKPTVNFLQKMARDVVDVAKEFESTTSLSNHPTPGNREFDPMRRKLYQLESIHLDN
ncbi:MAG: hypothetical protein M1834_000430 [Cirrosporium novae-zelandiae]|nr:MAG: hypothetical protein M1834_000430 [Cirrosporium novae-zelandiae]